MGKTSEDKILLFVFMMRTVRINLQNIVIIKRGGLADGK